MANDIFEKKYELYKGHAPQDILDAAIFTRDTLDLCWAAAQSIFGEKAAPSDAIEIYKLLLSKSKT